MVVDFLTSVASSECYDLFRERVILEAEICNRLNDIVRKHVGSSNVSTCFSKFCEFDASCHSDTSKACAALDWESNFATDSAIVGHVMNFAKLLKEQYEKQLKSVAELSVSLKSLSIDPKVSQKETAPFKLKPPDSKPSDSSRLGWMKPKKEKQTRKKSSKDKKKSPETDKELVDEEGFSIRPVDDNNDAASFYSSSDDADEDDSPKGIVFKIKPAVWNGAKTVGASTEELRNTASNLMIPEKPVNRRKGLSRDGNKGSTGSVSVDFNEMLGLRPSVSLQSLGSNLSNVDTSDGDSLPPPAQPPPPPPPRVKESPLLESDKSTPGVALSEPPVPQRISSLPKPPTSAPPKPPTTSAPSKPSTTLVPLNPSRAAPQPPPDAPPSNPNNSLLDTPSSVNIPVLKPGGVPPLPQRQLPSKPVLPTEPRRAPPALPPRQPSVKQDSFELPFSTVFDKSRRSSNCSNVSNPVFSAIRGPSPLNSSDDLDQTIPLSFSFHECINATIKSADLNTSSVKISGTISLSCPLGTVEKIKDMQLGAMYFELTNSAPLLDSNQIFINKQLVSKRDQEAVGDQTIYTIEPELLVEHLNSRPSLQSFQTIEIIKYQVELDSERGLSEETMHFVPLQIMSYGRSTEDSTSVKIEYMYNEGAFPKGLTPALADTRIISRLQRYDNVSGITSDPSADWDSHSKRATWHLGPLSPSSPGNGTGVLKAKFSHSGDCSITHAVPLDETISLPIEVGAQFTCDGSVTGVGVLMLSPDYRISVLQYTTVSGRYISQCV